MGGEGRRGPFHVHCSGWDSEGKEGVEGREGGGRGKRRMQESGGVGRERGG